VFSHLIHESDGRGFEGVLLGQVYSHLPDAALVGSGLRSEKLDCELIQSAQYCHLMFGLCLPQRWHRITTYSLSICPVAEFSVPDPDPQDFGTPGPDPYIKSTSQKFLKNLNFYSFLTSQ
jgi:hypothetical protein